MSMPRQWQGRVKLPAIAAPMFLVSNPELVAATCKAGLIGTFPALNQRSTEGLVTWLKHLGNTLAESDAPYGVNLIVHKTNRRLQADLEQVVRYQVPLVITSLGAVREVVDAVHGYGGIVFHDVVNIRHARKAAAAGVDGLIPVCAGAGGHAGTLSPFALVPEIRRFFDGYIILAGCISSGASIAAAIAIGADFAYLGTRFIATEESAAPLEYKQMLVDSTAQDVVYTPAVSGVPASFLRPSLIRAGLDPDNLEPRTGIDLGEELNGSRAWRDIWSAGQGVGQIDDIVPVAALCERLSREYRNSCKRLLLNGGAKTGFLASRG